MEEDNKSAKVKSPYIDFNINVSIVTLFGMAIGSLEEATSSVDKKAEDAYEAALNKIRSSRAPDKLRQCWLMRDAIMKRAAHGGRPIIAVGVSYGLSFATFVVIHNWLFKNRGFEHTFNTGVAGTVGFATFCLMSLRGLPRHQRAMVGAVAGAGFFFPAGLAKQKMVDNDKERKALGLKQNEQKAIKHVDGATTN